MTEEDKLYADELRKRALADYERLNMAINELEQTTSVTPSYNSIKTELKPCEDCIRGRK